MEQSWVNNTRAIEAGSIGRSLRAGAEEDFLVTTKLMDGHDEGCPLCHFTEIKPVGSGLFWDGRARYQEWRSLPRGIRLRGR